jgi:hypothetical protein
MATTTEIVTKAEPLSLHKDHLSAEEVDLKDPYGWYLMREPQEIRKLKMS